MSHVDDGTIQTYLDRQLEFAEPEARHAFEQHLASHPEDVARVAEACAIRERATGLLRQRDVGTVDMPPFEAVVERANAASSRSAHLKKLRGIRTLALAASVGAVFAVGWYLRPSLLTDQAAPASVASESEAVPGVNEPEAEPPADAAQLADQDRQPVAQPADDRAVGFAETDRTEAAELTSNRLAAPTVSAAARKAVEEAEILRQQERQVAAGAASGRGVPAAAAAPLRARRLAGEPTSRLLEGTVADGNTQTPIAGVRIIVSGTALVTTTDGDGRYRLTEVPAGRIEIRALAIGYEQGQATLVMDSTGSADLDIRLNPSVVALDEMVVTGARERQRLVDADSSAALRVSRDLLREATRDPTAVFAQAAGDFADWSGTTIADAERLLGSPVLAVEGWTIERVEVLDLPGIIAVGIVQRLESGVLLGLIQMVAPTAGAGRENAPQTALVEIIGEYPSVVIGRLWVAGIADLPRDSVESLLANLREAPRTN